MDWTSGYVADVAYTAGYFSELNPIRLPLALLNAGYAPPRIENACELGFGQGVSVAMHAAAQPGVKWFGDDFNPSHAAMANWMADAAGVKADLTDESFAEFCGREDLPDFDFISLHGIWSWISDENRALIVDFLRRKLKVGGIAYISYNVLPGWAPVTPLRDLLARHVGVMGAKGQSTETKTDAALGFVDQLMGLNTAYANNNPILAQRVASLKTMPKSYLAHEYLNRDWKPMYFADIAEQLSEAKLSFAVSATLSDAVDEAHLTVEQREFLAGIEDEAFRETVRDHITNAQFRKDYWIKGGRMLSNQERVEQIRAIRVMLAVPRVNVPTKLTTTLGEVNLSPEVYGPLVDLLADHRSRTVLDIEMALADKGLSFVQVYQAILLLTGLGSLAAVQPDKEVAAARPATRRLNAALCEQARYSDVISSLVSPLTGGGLTIGRFDQMFLAALQAGQRTPEDLAQHAWAVLRAGGQKLVKEGIALETEQENLDEFKQLATLFVETLQPLLFGLGVIETSAPQLGQKRR